MTTQSRSADVNETEHPVAELFRRRWSPYRFDGRPVEEAALLSCLEAARWAASSYNDQPWSWIVARREDSAEFAEMLECLVEANRQWARQAGVLLISVARMTFRANGKPNRVAVHDLGQAAAHLALQAAALGLQVHQMAGVNLSRIRAVYEIPEGFEPQTAIALGYPASEPPETDAERELERRQSGPRKREPLSSHIFSGKFGQPANLLP